MSNKKKQFYVTIPMLPEASLKEVEYSYSEDTTKEKYTTSFPSIAMLKNNLENNDNYSIHIIWTEPDKNTHKALGESNSERNLRLFYTELKVLFEKMKIPFESHRITELPIPYDEDRKKHVEFFKKICKSYERESKIYMDLTYGTKMSTIDEFASLVYADKTLDCYIKEVIYGKFVHENNEDGSCDYGTIFDMRCLYELNTLIQSCSNIPNLDIDSVLNIFGEG